MRTTGDHSQSTASSCSSDLDHSTMNISTDSTPVESERSNASSHSGKDPQETPVTRNHLCPQGRVQSLGRGLKEGENFHQVNVHDLRAFARHCPEHVVWEPSTHTVVLRKNTRSDFFGFQYVVKIYETFVKPPAAPEPETPDLEKCDNVKNGESDLLLAALSDVPLISLPWDVLKTVAMMLSVPMTVGHDWQSVAGAVGRTTLEVLIYDTLSARKGELPGMCFLKDWMHMGTVRQFLQVLSSLHRDDVCRVILNHYQAHPPQQ